MGNGPSYSMTAVTQWYFEGSKRYGKTGFEKAKRYFDPADVPIMTGRIVAVTGANTGIGFASAMEFAKLEADVHLICRDASKCEEAKQHIVSTTGNKRVYCHTCDVSLQRSIREFSANFTRAVPRLDILVNNAGCMPNSRTLTSEGNETIMATMLGGTMLLTDLLVPVLKSSSDARIINVSSGGAYPVKAMPEDLNFQNITEYDGTFFYAIAKRNQIELTEEWAKRLNAQKIPVSVFSMHPGWASTDGLKVAMKDFYDKNLDSLRSAAEGADTIVFLAANNNGKLTGRSGSFWFERQEVRKHMPLAWTTSSEKEKNLLWIHSAEYVGGLSSIPVS